MAMNMNSIVKIKNVLLVLCHSTTREPWILQEECSRLLCNDGFEKLVNYKD